jgi:hypothetical protein
VSSLLWAKYIQERICPLSLISRVTQNTDETGASEFALKVARRIKIGLGRVEYEIVHVQAEV